MQNQQESQNEKIRHFHHSINLLTEVNDSFKAVLAHLNDQLLTCQVQVSKVMLQVLNESKTPPPNASNWRENEALKLMLQKELQAFKNKISRYSAQFQKSWKYYISDTPQAKPKNVYFLEQRVVRLPGLFANPRVHGMCENEEFLFYTDYAGQCVCALEKVKVESESEKHHRFNKQPLKEPGGLCLASNGEYLCLTTQRRYLSVVSVQTKELVQTVILLEKPHSYARSCVFETSKGSIVLAFHGDNKLYKVNKNKDATGPPYIKDTPLESKKSIFRFCCNKNLQDLFVSTFKDQTCDLLDKRFRKIVALHPPNVEWQPQFCALTDDGLCLVVDFIGNCVYCFNLAGSACKLVAQNLRARFLHVSCTWAQSENGAKTRRVIDLLYQNTTDSAYGDDFQSVRLKLHKKTVDCKRKLANIKWTEVRKTHLVRSRQVRLKPEQMKVKESEKHPWFISTTSAGQRVYAFDNENRIIKVTKVKKCTTTPGIEYDSVESLPIDAGRLVEGMCFVPEANTLVYAFNRSHVCARNLDGDREAVSCVRQQAAPQSTAALTPTSHGRLFMCFAHTTELIKLQLRSDTTLLEVRAMNKYSFPKCIRTFACARVDKKLKFVFIFMDCTVMLSDKAFKKWQLIEGRDEWLPDRCAISTCGFVLISCDILRKIFLLDCEANRWCVVCRNARVSAWTLVQLPSDEAQSPETEELFFFNYHWNEQQTWCAESIQLSRSSQTRPYADIQEKHETTREEADGYTFSLSKGELTCFRAKSDKSQTSCISKMFIKDPIHKCEVTNQSVAILCESGTLLIYYGALSKNIGVVQLDSNQLYKVFRNMQVSDNKLMISFDCGTVTIDVRTLQISESQPQEASFK